MQRATALRLGIAITTIYVCVVQQTIFDIHMYECECTMHVYICVHYFNDPI